MTENENEREGERNEEETRGRLYEISHHTTVTFSHLPPLHRPKAAW